MSDNPNWQVARLEDIERRDRDIPVREHLGIRAFGINAYTPGEDGTLISEHDESGSGQEELYLVLDGNATFEIDGQTVTSLTVPDTNSFSVFTTVGRTIALPAGRHILRLAFDQAAHNGTVAGVDWIKFSPVAATPTAVARSAGAITGQTFTSAFAAVEAELDSVG